MIVAIVTAKNQWFVAPCFGIGHVLHDSPGELRRDAVHSLRHHVPLPEALHGRGR